MSSRHRPPTLVAGTSPETDQSADVRHRGSEQHCRLARREDLGVAVDQVPDASCGVHIDDVSAFDGAVGGSRRLSVCVQGLPAGSFTSVYILRVEPYAKISGAWRASTQRAEYGGRDGCPEAQADDDLRDGVVVEDRP